MSFRHPSAPVLQAQPIYSSSVSLEERLLIRLVLHEPTSLHARCQLDSESLQPGSYREAVRTRALSDLCCMYRMRRAKHSRGPISLTSRIREDLKHSAAHFLTLLLGRE